MTETTGYDFAHLAPAEAGLGRTFARPKAIAAACVVAIAGLGWFYVGLLTAAPGEGYGSPWLAVMQTLCRTLSEEAWSVPAAAITASMWGAMALAMMLPSTAPMILTYAEIAETAARKGDKIVSPLVIAAGYASRVASVFACGICNADFSYARRAARREFGIDQRVFSAPQFSLVPASINSRRSSTHASRAVSIRSRSFSQTGQRLPAAYSVSA